MIKIPALAEFVVECTVDNEEVGGRKRYPMRAREHVNMIKK